MRIAATLVLLMVGMVVYGKYLQQGFDRPAFYAAMQSDSKDQVESQLKTLEKASLKDKEAFYGTLLMKKAGLVGGPAKKLKLFKEGHKKLEAWIAKDSSNAEYRFLRIMIQENAPGILGYNKEEEKDGEFVVKHFKTLSPAVQKAINDYSKRSKVLNPALL